MDINTKKLKKNAFRVSKVRGLTASRVPGGCCNAEVMQQVVDIAKKYGNGQIHLTTRQGFEIEGIRMEDMDKVNKMLQPIIENLEINQTESGSGYPASGTRNVCACIVSVLLETIIRQLLQRGLRKLFSRMIFISRLLLQAVQMIVSRRECMTLESSE